MYVNGNVNISGAGVVNGTQSASQCAIYGLPGCTTITCGNSGAFIGTVYAPEAALTVSGSGGVSGGFTASTITVSNSGQVHYDEHLTTLGGSGYAVMSWNEI
jgi:choice-of-anchor A domain-containing protein